MVLKKNLSGLGFSFNISQLHSGPDRGSVVRIKRLFPGQPALESGLLREGDIILSVNKEPVKDLSYQVGFGVFKVIINPHVFIPVKKKRISAFINRACLLHISGFIVVVVFLQH